MKRYRLILIGLLTWFIAATTAIAADTPVIFKDASGRNCIIDNTPQGVVSLVPSITEILFRIGAGDAVNGVTYHDTYPPESATKPVVGGFFSPSLDRIEVLQPDLIFIADLHDTVVAAYAGKERPLLIQLPLDTFEDLSGSIRLLGQIFERETNADALIRDIEADLAHTAAKIDAIHPSERKRVMRLMGRDRIMTPGDDSFQNEMIRRAGGIPPQLGKNGSIVPVSLEEWQRFNPQVLYGCDGDREAAMKLLDQPGWRDVEAVRNGRMIHFPCDLTCRLASRTGYFVSCLAASIYGDRFAGLPPVRADGTMVSRSVPLALDYVAAADIVESAVNDYIHKTLLIHLASPMAVASTLDGFREQIRWVGNSYSPSPVWKLSHRIGLETSRDRLMRTIGRDHADTSLLFTGADMDNLSVQRQQFKEMTVYALVTAGVRTNAVRMAEDIGAYYEPGTINMIILANMRLAPRAMNRAIISATEAKTAALQDMDIRSAYTPMTNPATGTGTDNIIVVQGDGHRIENAGGHSKMGELIARAVYAGVQDAVFRQNGLIQKRSIFKRLMERRISISGLLSACDCGMDNQRLTSAFEKLLLTPRYAGFLESALSISDAYERGQVSDLSAFQSWADGICRQITGDPLMEPIRVTFSQPLPRVLGMALGAMIGGIRANETTMGNK